MSERPTYTHEGWFGMCPIYIANPFTDEAPALEARWWWLEWWFTLNALMFQAINWAMSYANPEHDGYFPIRITREIPHE